MIEYSIRKSKRAKRVSLRISSDNLLEVVVPYGFNIKKIPNLLEQKRGWIDKTRAQIADQIKLQPIANNDHNLPDKIHLRALGQLWNVEYRPTTSQNVGYQDIPYQDIAYQDISHSDVLNSDAAHSDIKPNMQGDNLLIIYGQISNHQKVVRQLNMWMNIIATTFLSDLLQQISIKTNLCYQKVTIRNQVKRWGSCSSKKAISLNQKLLFMPLELVEHILIHELCHTVHMNHSKDFWQLVGTFDSDFKRKNNQIKHEVQKKYIPHWA